ncbi:MAG: Dabb family protein [Limisphaerales bacterium]
MFSHIVVFWTNPAYLGAADDLLGGANQLLKDISGVLQFHAGKMVPSTRLVVEQSYQVALNLTFADKQAEQAYQAHPRHTEFVEKYVNRLVIKVVVYDFE